MKPNPICFTKQKFRFENEGERDFEKKRIDEIPYANLCSLLDVTLSIHPSLLFSLYVFAMFVYLLLSLLFFFLVSASIYRETPKKLFPYFSLNWSDHGAVFVCFFSFTILNFMLSRDPLFSFWLFYLFRCFLSSFFLVCDSPTFRLLRPNFIKPCSLLSGDATSLFTFQLFYFILLDLFLSISYVLGSRPLTWLLFLFS